MNAQREADKRGTPNVHAHSGRIPLLNSAPLPRMSPRNKWSLGCLSESRVCQLRVTNAIAEMLIQHELARPTVDGIRPDLVLKARLS